MRFRFIAVPSLVLCVVLPTGAGAQPISLTELGATPECDQSGNVADENGCIRDVFEREDAELNRVYRQAKAEAQEAARNSTWQKRQPEALRNAQRAWLLFRDAECVEAMSVLTADGNMNTAGDRCLIAKTRIRIVELCHIYGCE